METFLSAQTDQELVEVTAKIEMILINSWLGNYKLEHFSSILVVDCSPQTLFEISKFYKKIYISSCLKPEQRLNYVRKTQSN
jgi:hypothetical protein